MIETFALNFINLFVSVFNILILIRVLMSWVVPNPEGGVGGFIVDVTEPILAPIRRILPKGQMIDFSPIVAFILLQIIQVGIQRLLSS
jgi:YggT family protein